YPFTLGMMAAVNPCGFPLLPAYLTISSADAVPAPLAVRVLRALGSGLAVTVGFVLVFGSLGAVIKAGVAVAFGWLPWVMVPLGVACLAVGLITLAGRTLPLHGPSRRLLAGRRRGVALVGFGITYAIGSLACALPLFMGGVAGSFTQRGVGTGLADGLAYALGMGLVITAISLAGLGAQQLRLRQLRAAQPVLQRIAGGVLVLVGAYLVLYWVTYATSPLSDPAPVHFVEQIQSAVQGALSSSPRLVGAVIGLIVLVALGAASLPLLRRPAGRRPPGPAGHVLTPPSRPGVGPTGTPPSRAVMAADDP
ncbi:MAG TPA: cytochrome c biogenesis protein CcdA, partial [Acidimicrobiales bacterium]|nr:cytochrome c biogenesis protein CcdA [Acidimicrobiales bacterium]